MSKGPQSKEHRERSQPAARSRLGLLEKHKDYVKRARDYHSKQKRIKALQLKASLKNPDEFYMAMQSKQTKKGVHRETTGKALPTATVKLLKSQDLAYVTMTKRLNESKLAKLQADVAVKMADSTERKHFRFVEDAQELKSVKSEKPVEIDFEAMLTNAENVESECEASEGEVEDVSPITEESKAIQEWKVREERVRQLALAEKQLMTTRHLMGNGRRFKVGTDEYGMPIYRWATQRKK